jgi:hypothetical protein
MNMKIRNIFLILSFVGFITSCSDEFLDRPPISEISSENFYQTSEDLKLATAALYAGTPWGEWNYLSYLPVGEVTSGNMALGWNGDAVQFNTFSITGLNGGLIANWRGMYKVVAHCNTTIIAIQDKAPSSIPAADKNAAIAETKFIRAYAYFNLASLWSDVPIIEDNTKLIKSPLVHRNNVEDVFQFIVNDLTFAAQNLPVSGSGWEKGRVTTWSAQGLLAKVYLAWAGLKSPSMGVRDQALLDSAKHYAGNVCKMSELELLGNYSDLFLTKNNDNIESLFSLQWDASVGGWFDGNMLQIYSPGGTEISANGQAGWFSIVPTYDMYLQYSEDDTLRRHATFMLKDSYYPELNAAGGGFTYTGNAGLKKHIVGTRADNGSSQMVLSSSPEHNALLRLADVYLIYAEAILGNDAATSDADALLYFNLVRKRAGLEELSSINTDLILKERRIELAAEGHYWFDLVRLSYYDTPKAISILNNQERIPFSMENGVATPDDPFGIITPATSTTFKFPLPESELTANPLLNEPPVSYPF